MWQENWESVRLFQSVGSQWVMVGVGMGSVFYQGLDYSKVESTMNMRQIPAGSRGRLLDDLRVMEAAAKVALNRKLKG